MNIKLLTGMNDAKSATMKKAAVSNGLLDKLLMWSSFALFVVFEIALVWGFLKFCGRV